ncbi:unnamed protein product [Rhizophagus irregularis]|nr:unnamed protein product [Rhizophagus irregularis]CAB4413967.1 unnamed protein product [Rhizophagus irregularis]
MQDSSLLSEWQFRWTSKNTNAEGTVSSFRTAISEQSLLSNGDFGGLLKIQMWKESSLLSERQFRWTFKNASAEG